MSKKAAFLPNNGNSLTPNYGCCVLGEVRKLVWKTVENFAVHIWTFVHYFEDMNISFQIEIQKESLLLLGKVVVGLLVLLCL